MVEGSQKRLVGGEAKFMFQRIKLRLAIKMGQRPSSALDLPELLSDEEMQLLADQRKFLVPDRPVLMPVLRGSLRFREERKPIQYPENGSFVRSRLLNDGPRCLHCGSQEFYQGPQGGMAMNIKCGGKDCGWVYWYGGELGLKVLRKEVPGPFTFQEIGGERD